VRGNEFGNEDLPGGGIEGGDYPEEEREHVYVPQLRHAGEHHRPQARGEDAEGGLGGDEDLAPIEPVGEHAGDRGEEDGGDELQGRDDPDGEPGVVGELGEHEPVLGDALHPRTDVGDERPDEPHAVVIEAQGRECAAQLFTTFRRISSASDSTWRSSRVREAGRRWIHWSRRLRVSRMYSAPSSESSMSTERRSRGSSVRSTKPSDSRNCTVRVIDGGRTCSRSARSPRLRGP